MNDAREGIVPLNLPDGRAIPLQLTYAALDAKGHDWLLEQFKAMQKGRSGGSTALAEALEVMSGGGIKAADVLAAPMAAYPLAVCLKAVWAAWELAQYGPQGRSVEADTANPRKSARPTWLRRIFGRP